MDHSRGNLVSLAPLLLCSLITGCVEESYIQGVRYFRYELWVSGALFFGGVVVATIGFLLRQWSAKFGWALLVLGGLSTIGMAPSIYLDEARLSEESYFNRTGIWGLTAVHEVKFESIKTIQLTTEISRGRRGRKKTNHYAICELKDGSELKLPLNNAINEKSGRAFLQEADRCGIPIINGS